MGYSSFTNSKGEIIFSSNKNESDVFQVNAEINKIQTFYVKYGDYIGVFAISIFILLLIYSLMLQIKK